MRLFKSSCELSAVPSQMISLSKLASSTGRSDNKELRPELIVLFCFHICFAVYSSHRALWVLTSSVVILSPIMVSRVCICESFGACSRPIVFYCVASTRIRISIAIASLLLCNRFLALQLYLYADPSTAAMLAEEVLPRPLSSARPQSLHSRQFSK